MEINNTMKYVKRTKKVFYMKNQYKWNMHAPMTNMILIKNA